MSYSYTLRSDSITIRNTIMNVIETMKVCDNPRFKRTILYELLEYLCENKTNLYALGTNFGQSVQEVINNHLNDTSTNTIMKIRLHEYKNTMEDYFKWSNNVVKQFHEEV